MCKLYRMLGCFDYSTSYHSIASRTAHTATRATYASYAIYASHAKFSSKYASSTIEYYDE